MINDVHAAWNNDLVTTALPIDIKGYLKLSTTTGSCMFSARRVSRSPWCAGWQASLATGRQRYALTACAARWPRRERYTSRMPSLSYARRLVLSGADRSSAGTLPGAVAYVDDKPTAMAMFRYVDDGIFFVSSKSLKTNVALIDAAYGRAARWMRSAGLAPDVNKREIMHYSRRKLTGRREHESPSIAFVDDDGKARTISAGEHVR